LNAPQFPPPFWLPGGNAQTIWAATLARRHSGPPPQFTRERWATPDGDFIDVDHLAPALTPPPAGADTRAVARTKTSADSPPAAAIGTELTPKHKAHLVLFHGLEGSSASAYAQAFACVARERGWAYSVPHFRGCSGELNHAPRAYHSGDHEEIGWMLQRLRERHGAPLLVVGVSLGGNALLRWAQEAGEAAHRTAAAVAAVCSPIDMKAAGRAIDQGLNRLIYARMFLRSMKPRALAKLAQHPGLFDGERLRGVQTIFEFDDLVTAPLHGFKGAVDYYERASALPRLRHIRLPALVLNTGNDPFVPMASLPREKQIGRVTLWQPAHGGHVGFPQRHRASLRTHVLAMPNAVCDWLTAQGGVAGAQAPATTAAAESPPLR
jgi:uncharacterized protein